MLKYKFSLRSIARGKIYLLLNLLGLSIAFAIAIFILSYLVRELSYNRNFREYDRIARLLTVKKQFGWTEPSVSYPLHVKLKNDIPGIESASIGRSIRSFQVRVGESDLRIRSAYATTADILDIFTPEFIFASTQKFGDDPSSVLLSETLATKIFGSLPEPGSRLEVNMGGNDIVFNVDGVYRDFPETSSFRPELLASFELMRYEFPEGSFFAGYIDTWSTDLFREFILLEESADWDDVAERIALLADELPDELDYEFTLQPLSRIHLHSANLANDGRRGDIRFVLLFSAVGILILAIAISNYIILSTGASARRVPGISIRKIFGARSIVIKWYVLIESILVCLLSLPVAWVIYKLTYGSVKELFMINIELSVNGRLLVAFMILTLSLLTGLLSGSYLAGILGRTSPLEVFRNSSPGSGGRLLYKILITTQIVIFVSLLSSAMIVLRQINYSKNHDPGFNSDNLVIANFSSGLTSDFSALSYELSRNPAIEELSFGSLLPPTLSAMVTIIKPNEGSADIRVEGISADFNFVSTTGAVLVAGRDFNPSLAADSSASIINETLARSIGADPEKLHEIRSPSNVIGIMRDIQIHSARDEIGPMTLTISKSRYISSLLARVKPGSETEVKEYMVEKLREYNPLYVETETYKEVVESMYGNEARFGTIILVFGIIALVIASMGVFGLSLFLSNEQRFSTAVRRVFGASSRDIIRGNTLRYLVYIALGNIISVPLAVILMNRWLQQFAFRTSISPIIFLGAFTLSALVFIITTLVNTLRLSRINPVDNLGQ